MSIKVPPAGKRGGNVTMFLKLMEAGMVDPLKPGDRIYLEADDGKYLSRYNGPNIEAIKSSIDPFCQFIVSIVDPLGVAFQADDGKYVSRYNGPNIQAIKDGIDPFCRFTVWWVSSATGETWLALQADDGKYVSRYNGPNIQAIKDGIDPFCRFKVHRLST
jgi:hypothetical protein